MNKEILEEIKDKLQIEPNRKIMCGHNNQTELSFKVINLTQLMTMEHLNF